MDSLGVSDVMRIPVSVPAGFTGSVEGQDEWDCIWGHTEMPNVGQVVGHPLEQIEDLGSVSVPDYADDSRYAGVKDALEQAKAEGQYVTSSIFNLCPLPRALRFGLAFRNVIDLPHGTSGTSSSSPGILTACEGRAVDFGMHELPTGRHVDHGPLAGRAGGGHKYFHGFFFSLASLDADSGSILRLSTN